MGAEKQKTKEVSMLRVLRQIFSGKQQPVVPALCCLRGHNVVASLNQGGHQIIKVGKWSVGDFWFEAREGKWYFHTGIQTNVWREGKCVAWGENGVEEYMGCSMILQPGDTFRYDQIGYGFYEEADPPELHPDITVAIAA